MKEITFKYRAFISYSHADRRWGDWLHAALETYRVPRNLAGKEGREGKVPARLFPIFRDREELPTSSDLGANIREALEQSRFLVVICSPRAAHSHWVNEEILSFKRLGRENRILPLIVDGEPNASDGKPGHAPEEECFPPALRLTLGADGTLSRQRSEPIAADARPGRDGRDNAKLKLLAGLLGVDYDALRQRERERRRRSRIKTAVAVLALVAAFAALWLIQRQETTRKLRNADEAAQRILVADQQDADRKRVALIAGQVADESEERGRRELLAGHADAAATHLEKALANDPARSSARLMLGVARRGTEGAAAVFEQDEDVLAIDLSPTGKHLLVIGIDTKIAALWDVPGRRLVRKIPLDTYETWPGSRFNQSGDKLLLPGSTGWKLHDVATGGEVAFSKEDRTRTCFLGDGARILWLKNADDNDANATPMLKVIDAAGAPKLGPFSIGVGSAGGLQSDALGRTALAGWFRPRTPGLSAFPVGEPALKWFDVESGQILADLPRHDTGVMELSPDGERLLYLRADGIFEARSKNSVLWTLPTANDFAPEAHWSQGGKYAVVSSHGQTMVLDGSSGKVLWQDVFSSPATAVSDSFLAYADQQGVVHVRELATGRSLADFVDRIGWPDRSAFPQDRLACFTPDGQYLILAGSGHAVKIWDWRRAASDPALLGDSKGAAKPQSMEFSADGKLLGVWQTDGNVAIWEVPTHRLLTTIQAADAEGGAWTLAFSPDGEQVITGARQPPSLLAATVWKTATGEPLAQLDDGATAVSANGRSETRSPMLEQHIRVAWVGDRWITVNFNLGLGWVWSAATHAKVAEFKVGSPTLEPLAVGDEPRRLAVAARLPHIIVAGFDGTARVFDAGDGRLIATLLHPFSHLATAELSADGSIALTSSIEGQTAIWKVANAEQLSTLDAGPVTIHEAHLSANGSVAASACSDRCVRLWDTASGKLRHTFREEKPAGEGTETLGAPIDFNASGGARLRSGFLSLSFDPKGHWLAAINDEGRLCLWDLQSERQLVRWKLGEPARDFRLAIDPSGNWLSLTGIDSAVRLVHLSPADPTSTQGSK